MDEDEALLATRAATETWVVLGRLRRRLESLPSEGGLSPAQASVLTRLGKHGPASASELAAAERVRPQSMAKIVVSLEQAGLVERNPDPEDGRRQVITLTEQGAARRQGDREARQAWLAATLRERGSEEQIRAVITAMALLDEVAHS
ncbi:MarR family transcriptional regulator [Nonomuraea sp. NPDC049419]|uniref:MarR family winged helix-turn-helix transcriptional regulator n=1 Tax=Nonomuraea sp. NPDC049419 TaxID=3155772 RepID=UPI00342E6FCF